MAKEALREHSIEKDQAAYIKKEFDKRFGPTWHCVVGRHFGSYVTHETKHFIYFYLDQVSCPSNLAPLLPGRGLCLGSVLCTSEAGCTWQLLRF